MIKTVVVIEHTWNDNPTPHNKDVSVLPYIDGICRLHNYELFYGRYIDEHGFYEWINRFGEILRSKDRRIILYLAGHGSNNSLGGIDLKILLKNVWIAANNLNVEGCILGGCFVGQNIDNMKSWMTDSKLTWIVGYRYAVDWLPSTLLDMSIISEALSYEQDHLNDRNKLTNLLLNSVSLFSPSSEMSSDKNNERKTFSETVTCVIQPRIQGQKPVTIELFNDS